MAEEVKFSEDELKFINEIQQTYIGIQNGFGRIGVSRLRVDQDISNLNQAETDLRTRYQETQAKERKFVDDITKKYGDGQLNLDTGTFVKREEIKTENKETESK